MVELTKLFDQKTSYFLKTSLDLVFNNSDNSVKS